MIDGVLKWLSQHPDQANVIAAVANVAVAALALIVAAISILFTYRGLKIQRQHNHLSVKPIPFIACADYEDHLRVRVRNDGIGPLIIKGIDVLTNGSKQHDELVSYMPDLPPGVYWSNFSSGEVSSIPAGGEHVLLELKLDLSKKHHTHFREECRKVLQTLTVIVNYTDIYENSFQPVTRDLNWFGRRLASSRATS